MSNEKIEGLVPTDDGCHAVMVDPKNNHCGWVFVKQPDGLWGPEREASLFEQKAAQRKCALSAVRDTMQDDHNRLVRELDVLLNGETGAAEQASLCDIVAQVRWARSKPGTGALQLLALIPDQVVGRVYATPLPATVELNSAGRALADGAPLYSRPADTYLRYVRVPSRNDPKYHETFEDLEGGPEFNGQAYVTAVFESLKQYGVIVVETLPEGAIEGNGA